MKLRIVNIGIVVAVVFAFAANNTAAQEALVQTELRGGGPSGDPSRPRPQPDSNISALWCERVYCRRAAAKT